MERELESILELEIEEQRESGLSLEEARYAARLALTYLIVPAQNLAGHSELASGGCLRLPDDQLAAATVDKHLLTWRKYAFPAIFLPQLQALITSACFWAPETIPFLVASSNAPYSLTSHSAIGGSIREALSS